MPSINSNGVRMKNSAIVSHHRVSRRLSFLPSRGMDILNPGFAFTVKPKEYRQIGEKLFVQLFKVMRRKKHQIG